MFMEDRASAPEIQKIVEDLLPEHDARPFRFVALCSVCDGLCAPKSEWKACHPGICGPTPVVVGCVAGEAPTALPPSGLLTIFAQNQHVQT